MKKRLLFTIVLCLLVSFLTACRQNQSSGGDDFNASSVSFLYAPCSIAATDQGFYFFYQYFLYYYDYSKKETIPVCFKTNCRHHREEDPEKVTGCDAFMGMVNEPFVGFSNGRLYVTALNLETNKIELLEMKEDGSDRKVIIDNCNGIDACLMRIHRGTLYYPTSLQGLDGASEKGVMAVSLEDKAHKEQIVFRTEKPGISFTQILPVGNHVYIAYEKKISGDNGSSYLYTIISHKISDQKNEIITEEDSYYLYGVQKNDIILRKDGQYYCFKEKATHPDIQPYTSGISIFANSKPDWNCHPDCIADEFTFFSCFDKSESVNDFVGELYMVGSDGAVACRIPDESWGVRGAQVIKIGGDELFVKYAAHPENETILMIYRTEDLLQGIVQATPILKKEEIKATSYIIDIR